jgi:hypothetical protein
MEQIRGTGTSPRSDIYSLSATLYQLLTNVVPPDALSRADFLLSGKTDPIAPINEVNNEIPKSISDVVLKGMSISQDQRFTDAREMQRVLRETYAQMQSAMADQTVAFVAPEAEPAPAAAAETSSFSNDKTEQFSAPVFENQPASKEAMGAQTIPFGMVGNTEGEGLPTNLSETGQNEPIPNFDQTLRIEDIPQNAVAPPVSGEKTEVLPVGETLPKQADIRTEAFGGDFGAAEYLRNEQSAPPKNLETGDYSAKTDENFAVPSQNFTGDKTVPFIGVNEKQPDIDLAQTQPVSAFESVPQAEKFASTAETRLPTNEGFAPTNGQAFPNTTPNYEAQPKPMPPTPAVRPVPQKKKSKGLLFGILGALFGLVILAAAGGGIAWYMMYYQGPTNVTNTTTPTPAPTPTATPEQTPEQANTDTGNTSNSDVVTTTSPGNSVVNTTPSPSQTKPLTTQPTVVTTQPTRVTTTPKPATPKPVTPKPEPTKKLRGTDIPQ